jgi:hypothetical protein
MPEFHGDEDAYAEIQQMPDDSTASDARRESFI